MQYITHSGSWLVCALAVLSSSCSRINQLEGMTLLGQEMTGVRWFIVCVVVSVIAYKLASSRMPDAVAVLFMVVAGVATLGCLYVLIAGIWWVAGH